MEFRGTDLHARRTITEVQFPISGALPPLGLAAPVFDDDSRVEAHGRAVRTGKAEVWSDTGTFKLGL